MTRVTSPCRHQLSITATIHLFIFGVWMYQGYVSELGRRLGV
jgi:hypothetical protein